MINFNNVSKIYKNKKNNFLALKNINIQINDGASLGVVGISGAGKSTFIRLINGLIKPTEGDVLIDGININLINLKTINNFRKNIGMVFQHFNLFSSLTVFENVKLALKIYKYKNNDINDKVYKALEQVGLKDKASLYPRSLSGGEKQRVGIARAIINNPKYLLLDEITSALDQKTAFEVIDYILKIKEKTNMTIIFISHQLEMIRRLSDEVIILDKGEIIEKQKTIDLYLNPQTNTAKNLIQILKDAIKFSGKNRYLLTYGKDALNKTLLSETIMKFKVEISIILAETISIKENTIGYLLIDISGNNKFEAINYLQNQNIKLEKIKGGNYNDSI